MRLFLLLITCGVLFIAVYFETFREDETSSSITTSSVQTPEMKNNRSNKASEKNKENPARQLLSNPYSDLKLASLSATVDRPLFTKSRRAPAPPAQAIAVPRFIKKPEKKKAEYILMGILKNGTRSVALLREKETGKYYRVEKGDIVGSNRVTEVLVKSIQMEREDGTSTKLVLKFTR